MEERKNLDVNALGVRLAENLVTVNLDRKYFELSGGRRFTLNEALFYELWKLMPAKECLVSWEDIIKHDVLFNSALYFSSSILVRTLLTKSFEVQRNTLVYIAFLAKRSGRDAIELTASEWLLFARACEYIAMRDGVLLTRGVDSHAKTALNSINKAQIQGLTAIVKENDVPFLQWEKAS